MLAVWISRLAIVNVLWIIFTIFGLGIFGFGPATAAMSSVISRWISSDQSFSVFRHFTNVYRNQFLKTNLIFLSSALIGAVLVYNYFFIQANNLPFFYSVITIVMGMTHLLISITIIPLYINNHVSILELFKTSALFVIGYPLNSMVIVLAIGGLILIQLFMPGLLFFFSGSAITFVVVLRIQKVLEKTRAIQAELSNSLSLN